MVAFVRRCHCLAFAKSRSRQALAEAAAASLQASSALQIELSSLKERASRVPELEGERSPVFGGPGAEASAAGREADQVIGAGIGRRAYESDELPFVFEAEAPVSQPTNANGHAAGNLT